jgi:hypothetical protein
MMLKTEFQATSEMQPRSLDKFAAKPNRFPPTFVKREMEREKFSACRQYGKWRSGVIGSPAQWKISKPWLDTSPRKARLR